MPDERELLTFTDVTEPDVLQGACTKAVDALQLPGTDDDVGDGRAIVKNEHGAVTSGVIVGVAVTAAIEFLVAVVNGARNRRGLRERDNRTRASRDVESLGRGEGCQRGEKGSGVKHLVWIPWFVG